ncbi:MAG: NupC/NupG family nucleoside CNT transporter [Planctomycetes bacterium]|nr:NupC/NupG family nucleoside CNT transporter [Planctomycetota bacterium]
MYRAVSFAGYFAFVALAWWISEDRRKVHWRAVTWGTGLQWALGAIVIWLPPGKKLFELLGGLVDTLIKASDEGAGFVFGRLTSEFWTFGTAVGFRVLPIVVFVSAAAGLLHHWGIVQAAVRGMAWLMKRTMRISGLEALGAALFVFFGIETVTGISGYVKKSTRSEMFTLMTAFMATIAGSVLTAYVSMGIEAKHLLAASLMSAPAAIMTAKLMVPEKEAPETSWEATYRPEITSTSSVDALSQGAMAGMKLALNIAACLIAFVGAVKLANMGLEWAFGTSVEKLLGYVLSPVALLMGVPLADAMNVGELLGIKTVLNEFLAYERMTDMANAADLSERGKLIGTYALCGFANFGSIAILVGGISTIAPERRSQVAALGLKALAGGTLAAFLTACVAGTLG